MIIQNASVADINEIIQLEEENFTSDKWKFSQWENEFLKNEFANVLLLKDEEIVVGYIDFWILFEQATIAKMCIKKEYTNRGLGDYLLKEALKIIDKNNCLLTTLEVRVSNEFAIKLYSKNLFKTNLVKKGYYSDGEDCFYMIRSIGDVYEK